MRERDLLRTKRWQGPLPRHLVDGLRINGLVDERRNGDARLRLVGVAAMGSEAIAASTKVGPILENTDWIRLLMRALARYGASLPVDDPDHAFLTPPMGGDDGSLIALARWLLEDYRWNGLYKRMQRRRTLDGSGSPDWPRTIETERPLMSRGTPVHLEPVTERSMVASTDLFSITHKRVLQEASRRFGDLLGLLPVDLSHEPIGDISPGMTERALAAGLRREIRHVFDDRGLRLIRALIAWLEQNVRIGHKKFHVYGAGAFHTVWERVCQDILGDELRQWSDAIPYPDWTHEGGASAEARDTLRPDTIVRDGDRMTIVDAKYYNIGWPPNLAGQPGVSDITKQIMYRRVLLPEARKRNIRYIGNVFIVPNVGDHEAILSLEGRVELGKRRGMGVDVLSIGIRRALSLYVAHHRVSNEERERLLAP